MFKFIFLLIPFLYIAASGYLFWKAGQALSFLPLTLKIISGILFWIVAFALIATIFLHKYPIPEIIHTLLYQIGSIWMVLTMYMVLMLLIADIVRLTFHLQLSQGLFWYSLGLTILLLVYGYYNYRTPAIRTLDIAIDKKFDGENIRIVAVSDFHLGHGTGKKSLKRYVEMINSQTPDLIIIAGDLIDNSITPVTTARLEEELSQLKAPLGIYMVPGNHEHISGYDDCEEFLSKTPIKMLRDSIVTLPNKIQLICRDDIANKERLPLNELYMKADRSLPLILADHTPRNLAESDSLGTDLQISGHTHHGQIWPISLITDMIFEQSHGYRKWEHAHIWVSSGISLWGPPVRIGTKGDIAVINLRSK